MPTRILSCRDTVARDKTLRVCLLTLLLGLFCFLEPISAVFAQSCDSSLRPTPGKGPPSQVILGIAYVEIATGRYVPDCPLKATPDLRAGTYGHNAVSGFPGIHAAAGPPLAGTVQPPQGDTGSEGRSFIVTFTAPQVSSIVRLLMTPDYAQTPNGRCDDGTPIQNGYLNVCVSIPGLAVLENNSPDFLTTCGNPTRPYRPCDSHPINRYGTPAFLTVLRQLAKDFLKATGKKLTYNDISLEKGGLFDVDGQWTRGSNGHNLHRAGIDADVNFDYKYREVFERLVRKHGLKVIHHDKYHYHVQLP